VVGTMCEELVLRNRPRGSKEWLLSVVRVRSQIMDVKARVNISKFRRLKRDGILYR